MLKNRKRLTLNDYKQYAGFWGKSRKGNASKDSNKTKENNTNDKQGNSKNEKIDEKTSDKKQASIIEQNNDVKTDDNPNKSENNDVKTDNNPNKSKNNTNIETPSKENKDPRTIEEKIDDNISKMKDMDENINKTLESLLPDSNIDKKVLNNIDTTLSYFQLIILLLLMFYFWRQEKTMAVEEANNSNFITINDFPIGNIFIKILIKSLVWFAIIICGSFLLFILVENLKSDIRKPFFKSFLSFGIMKFLRNQFMVLIIAAIINYIICQITFLILSYNITQKYKFNPKSSENNNKMSVDQMKHLVEALFMTMLISYIISIILIYTLRFTTNLFSKESFAKVVDIVKDVVHYFERKNYKVVYVDSDLSK